MGLFRSKDKTRSAPTAVAAPTLAPPIPSDEENRIVNHCNNDSFQSSNISSADTRINQSANHNPGTTTTTTTTTTTATTTVHNDGTSHTTTHSYDPSIDPAPASSTTYPSNEPPLPAIETSQHIHTPMSSDMEPQSLRRTSTGGGRVIPERSPLLNSNPVPPLVIDHTVDPKSSNTTNIITNPISHQTNSQANNDIHNKSLTSNSTTTNPPRMPITEKQRSDSPIKCNVNFSRPGGKRESIANAARGIHGAGEALRGSVNSAIAGGFGDQRDLEQNRAIKEQGMKDFTNSGFREKAGNRLRRRSGGIPNGSQARAVGERV